MTNNADYSFTVANVTGAQSTTNFGSNTFTTHVCGYWCNHTTAYPTYYSYPTYIYLYQIVCPKCEISNFIELEKIIPCTSCSATLKATAEIPDFTVSVKK